MDTKNLKPAIPPIDTDGGLVPADLSKLKPSNFDNPENLVPWEPDDAGPTYGLVPANQEELRRQESGGLKPWNPEGTEIELDHESAPVIDVGKSHLFETHEDHIGANEFIESKIMELPERTIEPDDDSEAEYLTVWKTVYCARRECKVRVKPGYHGFVRKTEISFTYSGTTVNGHVLGNLMFVFGTNQTGQAGFLISRNKGNHYTHTETLANSSGERNPGMWKSVKENPDFFDYIKYRFIPASGSGAEFYLEKMSILLNNVLIYEYNSPSVSGTLLIPYHYYSLSSAIANNRSKEVLKKVTGTTNSVLSRIIHIASTELGKAWGPKYCMPARNWKGLITEECCSHFVKWVLSEAGFSLKGCYEERNGYCLDYFDILTLRALGITDYKMFSTHKWMRIHGLMINAHEGHNYDDLGNKGSKSYIRPGYTFSVDRNDGDIGHVGIFLGWDNPDGTKEFKSDNLIEVLMSRDGNPFFDRKRGNRFWAISNTGSRVQLTHYYVYDTCYYDDLSGYSFTPENAICWRGVVSNGMIVKQKHTDSAKQVILFREISEMKAITIKTLIIVIIIIGYSKAFANDYDPIPGDPEVDYEPLYWDYFDQYCGQAMDPFPSNGWLLYSSNTDHTWEASDIAFDGSVMESDASCFAFVEADGTWEYNELLITPNIMENKIKEAGCKDFFVYIPHIINECNFSIEINQEDDLEDSTNWKVVETLSYVYWPVGSDSGPFSWHYNKENEIVRWRDDADFFDRKKGFRVGFRYEGNNCLGVAVPEIEIGCYYDYFNPDDYDDDDYWGDDDDIGLANDDDDENEKNDDEACSCGASGSGPNMLPVLLMVFIGLVFWRFRKAA